MDAFNLRWPGGDATLHTDGDRCRVVWRAANGMGGSIENTVQAKRRVAAGLGFAPGLLDELKAAGYVELATELERIAPSAPAPEKRDAPRTEPTRAEKKPIEKKPRVTRWLDALPDGTFEACGARRATKWHQGKTWPEWLSLKTPVAGKGDWVLKVADGETRYFAAEGFVGICRAFAAQEAFANEAFVDAFLEGCKALRQKEVTAARDAWEATAAKM